jgi:hypothetical protein
MHNLRKSSLGWSQGTIWVSLLYYYISPWYMCFPLCLSEIRHISLFNQFETIGSARPQVRKKPWFVLPFIFANSPDIFALAVLYFCLCLPIQPLSSLYSLILPDICRVVFPNVRGNWDSNLNVLGNWKYPFLTENFWNHEFRILESGDSQIAQMNRRKEEDVKSLIRVSQLNSHVKWEISTQFWSDRSSFANFTKNSSLPLCTDLGLRSNRPMLTVCELKHDSRAMKNSFQSIKSGKLEIFWSSRRETHGRNWIRLRSRHE